MKYSKICKVCGKCFRYNYEKHVVEFIFKADSEILKDNEEWQTDDKKSEPGRQIPGIMRKKMEYGIYEILTDEIGREMVDNYKRIRVKRDLSADDDKRFYQKILDDLNAEFKRRFSFDWEENGY